MTPPGPLCVRGAVPSPGPDAETSSLRCGDPAPGAVCPGGAGGPAPPLRGGGRPGPVPGAAGVTGPRRRPGPAGSSVPSPTDRGCGPPRPEPSGRQRPARRPRRPWPGAAVVPPSGDPDDRGPPARAAPCRCPAGTPPARMSLTGVRPPARPATGRPPHLPGTRRGPRRGCAGGRVAPAGCVSGCRCRSPRGRPRGGRGRAARGRRGRSPPAHRRHPCRRRGRNAGRP